MVGSRPPYGFRFVRDRDEHDKPRKFLEIYKPEAVIRELLYIWYAFGDGDGKAMTLMQIARKLTRDGVPTRTDWRRRKYADDVWSESTVRELLKSEVSIGTWHYGKKKRIEEPNSFYANGKPKVRYVPTPRSEWIAVSIPAIVDRELWQTAQERFSENKIKATRNRKNKYLFSGMMICAACKGAYIGNHGERGYERQFYVCRGHSRIADSCTMPVFREHEIDMVVWPWIKEIATHFERVEATLQQQQTETDEQNTRINALIANTDRTHCRQERRTSPRALAFQKRQAA